MESKQSGWKPVTETRVDDSKDIGAKILASDLAISGVLDSGPIFSIEQSLALEPVRDGLLTHGLDAKEVANGSSKGALAVATKLDRPTKGGDMIGNVFFLHGGERYTRILVGVNKKGCFTDNKDTCKVLQMQQPARAKKLIAPKKPSKKASAEIGPDGFTLGQRLHRLMAERGIGQTELARMCSHYYAAFVPGSEDKFKQQHIFNVLQGQNTAEVLPVIATVLDVSALWLQLGIGKKEN